MVAVCRPVLSDSMQGVLHPTDELPSIVTCAPGGSVKNCTLCSAAPLGEVDAAERSGCGLETSDFACSRGAGFDISAGLAGSAFSEVVEVEVSACGAVDSGGACGAAGCFAASSELWDWPTGLGLLGEFSAVCAGASVAGCSAFRLNKYFCAPNKTKPASPITTSIHTNLRSSGLDGSLAAPLKTGASRMVESSSRRNGRALSTSLPPAGT